MGRGDIKTKKGKIANGSLENQDLPNMLRKLLLQ